MNTIEWKNPREGECIRQGDVLVIRCKDDDVPKKATEVPRDNGGVVLAYGEVTGHSHQFRDPGICMLRAEGVSDAIVTIGLEGGTLGHEEHTHFAVPSGTYRARIQRQWDGQLSRRVED